MKNIVLYILFFSITLPAVSRAQEVPIQKSSVDANGRIQIEIESSTDYYYILYSRHKPQGEKFPVSMTFGEAGSTLLTESLAAYPAEHYSVERYLVGDPKDTDGDGLDDVTEMLAPPTQGPLNPARAINIQDGVVSIHNHATYQQLSYQGNQVLIDTHLEGLEFVKFYILDAHTNNPKVYFMNTVTHRSHGSFARAIGIPFGGFGGGGGGSTVGQMRGEIIYHPKVAAPNGRLGVYRFEFQPNDAYSFAEVQLAYEILAANLPLLENNLAYYPMPNAALPKYVQEKDQYDASRIAILLEEDIFDEVDYIPFNITEGYGLLRVMELEERPNSRDIVLYESLPNEMPRVGGIITTVPQTPLSHVNLRAIQDGVPNAYIRGALGEKIISDLVGKYVYYKAGQESYEIREASLEEVEAHYADLRPSESQTPVRDLSITGITPLDEISFIQSSSFGAKAANVATMRTFGFPEGTIPNGFGIPFYFYDEFMKYNNFYDQAQQMLDNPDFQTNFDVQEERLKAFRKTIKEGDMPQWMLDQLDAMHKSFPAGTSIRCRSSTNNEDLPGFSGAGLYDSKTQHPDEGHISKSIKQVYASMWNFRAYDEQQFYRVDHFAAAMGVLVHPNFSNEKANGVGVSTDPIFQTKGTFYLNTQVGEDLVTNPDALSIPEEILLEEGNDYTIIRPSNLVSNGQLIMSEAHLEALRSSIQTIHDEFKILYQADADDDFAMEIEYKITSDDRLSIKQARPWVAYWRGESPTAVYEVSPPALFELNSYPNPFRDETRIEFTLASDAQVEIMIVDGQGRQVKNLLKQYKPAQKHSISWDGLMSNGASLPGGVYFYQLKVVVDKRTYISVRPMLKL